MEGALAGLEPVRVALVQREEGASVLHQDPGVAGDEGRTEIVVRRLDLGDGEAVIVDDAEIDGVAARSVPVGFRPEPEPRLDCVQCSPWIDELATLGGVLLVEEPVQRDVDELRIGQPLIAVGESDLHGLYDVVVVVGRPFPPTPDIEAFEQIQNLERGEALGGGWHLEGLVAAVCRADRIDPLGAVLGEVFGAQRRALRFERTADATGDVALVEGSGAVGRDRFERTGQVGLDEARSVAF